MTDTTTKDLSELSDEDFLKLSPEDFLDDSNNADSNGQTDDDQSQSDAGTPVDDATTASDGETNEQLETPAQGLEDKQPQNLSDGEQGQQKTPLEDGGQSDEKPEEKGKKPEQAATNNFKLPDGVTPEQVNLALDFYTKITAPIKADGKEIQVRSPDDVVRLVQQGVNYSRRMEELKPAKNLHRMLKDNGLSEPAKLNLLIEVARGDKNAITQLLKDHKIDPMDLDTTSNSQYQARSYEGNPQDNAFRDALDNTIASPEGQALVSEIHKEWDALSKNRLRENPALLGDLLELKRSGVYSQIVNELNYQKSLGYLTDIPFLQAFDQVGLAMKNAGVFNKTPTQEMGHLQSKTQQPLASGPRKATVPKTVPNPHLSSAPASKPTITASAGEVDFDALTDADFLKMKPPV